MISVEVTQESATALRIKLDTAQKGVLKGLNAGIRASIIFLASYIKKNELSGQILKNRTGNLRRAVFSKLTSENSGIVGVGAEAPYGRFLNDGARAHIIEASAGKSLRFMVGGNVLFRKSVNHPGNKAYQFMQKGLADSIPDITRIIHNKVNAGLHGQETEGGGSE